MRLELRRCHATDAASLGGTWRAWIASSASAPSTRFTRYNVPYVRIDGVRLANNWADLTDGTLATTLTVSETGGAGALANSICGGTTPGQQVVWSGTRANGDWQGWDACGGFTSTSGGGLWGNRTNTSNWWSEWCSGGDCNWVAPIYCFEQ